MSRRVRWLIGGKSARWALIKADLRLQFGIWDAQIWDGGSHCQEHEHNDGGSDDQDFVRDEEGDVGDEDEEKGGGEGGDDGALHPPHQVDLELKVGVGAHAILGVLSKFFKFNSIKEGVIQKGTM